MDLWQCKLRVSRQARCCTFFLHTVAMLLLVLALRPQSPPALWVLVVVLIGWESLKSQQRIRQRCGSLSWPTGWQLHWREQRWFLQRPPWLTPWLILLTLRNAQGQREQLWLFADAMSPAEWRLLRQRLLTSQGEG